MRRIHVVLIVALAFACSGEREPRSPVELPELATAGPDPLIVRVPRSGGLVKAFRFDNPDSAIWTAGHRAPPTARVLAFDGENGVLAFVDSGGTPGWVDFRLGTVRRTVRARYKSVASADGWSVYATTANNTIVRLTPTGDWKLELERPITKILPSPNGTLLVLTSNDDGSKLLRLRPPDDGISDSASFPGASGATLVPLGDRVYVATVGEVFSVAPNELDRQERYETGGELTSLAPTPSGDRVFVASAGTGKLELLDRYATEIRNTVELPGPVAELRMDPFGRYLIARPDGVDSAWVVSISDEVLLSTLPTRWRSDLPTVALDGTVATLASSNVVFVDPGSGETRRTVEGGASDNWFFMRWNGFRPRATGIDEPVSFAYEQIDTTTRDTVALPPIVRSDTATTPPPPTVPPVAPPTVTPRSRGWTVSFAAVLSLERAREIAAGIAVDGARPRVVTGETGGTTVYRVVLGPYDTRDAAERVGRASGHSFWIYEASP